MKAKTSSDFLLKSKRTERFFYWERINDKYSETVNDPSLKKEAHKRYSQGQNHYSINKCQGDLQNCNAYKAYCIEEVSSNAMTEEITEWNDRVSNCLNPKYRELHPDYCTKDFKKSLLYLKRMANELAKTNQSKSPDVARFFNEARDKFQDYYDEMDKLLASIDREKEKEKKDIIQAEKKAKVESTLDICRDIIKADDNDIGSKMYVDKILMNYSCPSLGEAQDLNQDALTSLESIMSDIDLKTQERHIYPKVTDLAMNQSVKATAATYMRFFGDDLDLSDPSSKNKFVKYICSKLDDEYCKKPSIKASMYQALNELDKETKNYKIEKISKEELLKDTRNFNLTLKKANSFCKDINKQAQEIEKNNRCSGVTQYMDKYDRMTRSGTDAYKECHERKQKKYAELKDLNNANRLQAEKYYAEATSTISGHLLITEDFRDKVDLPSRDWINERCIKGDGEAFHTVTEDDVKEGLDDLLKLNIAELSDISDQKSDTSQKRSIIKDYLKNNPNTIAALLEENPEEEYAKAICGFVREINKSDYIKVWGERAVVGVGVVAGVALSITGIGAPIGVPLLATVGTATALEAGSIVYDINDLNYNLKNKRQAASTGQLNLNQAFDEFNTADDEIFSRKIDLALTLSFGTLDIAAESAKSARLFYKTNEALKTKKILGLSPELSEASTKTASRKITQGFNNFSYHAKRTKLNPESLKNLSDAQKMELGAIYSELSYKNQRLLTKMLSEIKDPKELSTLLSKLSDTAVANKINGKLDFNALYTEVQRSIKVLPNSGSMTTMFKKSDELLYLNSKRLSKNKDLDKAKGLANDLGDWYMSDEVFVSPELSKKIEDQLTRNGVEFKPSGNGYIISAKGDSELSRFTKRMNELGVEVIYNPSKLKSEGIQGAYSPNTNIVFLDDIAVLKNEVTPVSFHEGSHVYGIEKYLQGYDDDLNLSFKSIRGGNIFTPSAEALSKYNKVPYLDGFWAQESKVFSNEIRQNTWANKVNLAGLESNVETLKILNENALTNSQRVLDKTKELKTWLDKDIPGMVTRHLSVSPEIIKGEKVFSFELKNFSVRTGPEAHQSADIKTSIKAVTEKQKDLVKRYVANKNDPNILREILNEFDLKATNYQNLTNQNQEALKALSLKVKALDKTKDISKADQKELIQLSAKVAKTIKTPIPKGEKFRTVATIRSKNLDSPNLIKSEVLKLDETKIEIRNLTDAETMPLGEVVSLERSLKSKKLNWAGGFEIKTERSYPSFNHVIRGNIDQGPKGPILREGMHTEHSLSLLLKKNKTYADEMLTPEGYIKSKYYRSYDNGVVEIRLPILDESGNIIRGSKGVKTVPKNLFPNSWDKVKILEASRELKNKTTAVAFTQSKKGEVFVYEGIVDEVSMRVIVSKDGDLITAYPSGNVGATRAESAKNYKEGSNEIKDAIGF